MNLAVFNYGLPVLNQKPGGVDQVAHDLAQGLVQRGHSVTVWTMDPKPPTALYTVHALPCRTFIRNRVGRVVTMGYLGNVLALLPDYGDCDAIIAHGDSLFLPLLGRPLIRIMHGSALGEALSAAKLSRFVQQLGIYPLELLSSLLQPFTVAVSLNTRRYNPFVRRMIPLGIDQSLFRPVTGAKSKEPSILFVGTMGGRKRGALLLKWFQEYVRATLPTCRLHLVAPAGPAVEGVTYHAGIAREDLAHLYRACWIYASPSTYEGFGLPYLEALASGTPVVTSPNPGSKEVLENGDYGLLVEDDLFPRSLLTLLADEQMRSRMAERGLKRARSFTVERMVDEYESLLAEVVRQRIPNKMELS